ncbi:MAG: hypothetical protein LC122_12220 [Chitinophagales bacterium]|nr:hypothetical protein [Chitinophagales bacterium]
MKYIFIFIFISSLTSCIVNVEQIPNPEPDSTGYEKDAGTDDVVNNNDASNDSDSVVTIIDETNVSRFGSEPKNTERNYDPCERADELLHGCFWKKDSIKDKPMPEPNYVGSHLSKH